MFFGLTSAYALVGSPGSPIPLLLVFGAAAFGYLRRNAPGNLWRASALRPALPSMLTLWVIAAVAMIAVVAWLLPDDLFNLPREQAVIWAAVAVFYPLLSVYPQELIFRGFLMHRYAPVFGTGPGIIAASAAAFGFVHIIYGSIVSVVLTLAAGWLFARRYQRTQSLLAVSVEHALYGVLAFTVGLGDFFYHGANR